MRPPAPSRLVVVVLTATSLLAVDGPPASGLDAGPALAEPALEREVEGYRRMLGAAPGPSMPIIPSHPEHALVEATATLSAELGFPQDPAPAIRAAGLPDEWAARLALVLSALNDCRRVTARHLDAIPIHLLGKSGLDLIPHRYADIRRCGERLWDATRDLEATLRAGASLADVDLWPVLRLDEGGDDTYLNDYLLIVELGGDDTYVNNVGSNMVDLNYGPPNSVGGLRGFGPAKGCQRSIPGLVARDCVPAAAVLIDMQGADNFGVKQTPDFDAGCTGDPVVRRMVVGGVGFLGVGILLDAGESDDRYTGKTVSLGAGHIFGVGLLVDRGGNDAYSAVRNGEGFALLGGLGILLDEGGSDGYDYYMPSPLDPSALNEAEGAGGVRDDTALCDRIPRFVQGAANLVPGTLGLLIDEGGDDRYHGAFVESFISPIPGFSQSAGSLGFGANLGTGVFWDRGGADKYVADGEPVVEGVPRRGNGVVIGPGSASTGTGRGTGAFVDE